MSRYGGDFRVRGWGVCFTTFTLKELSKITGLSVPHLRVWKQRGHVPGSWLESGSFTSRDVAEVLVRHRLSLSGMRPSKSDELGCIATQHLLWHAIVSHPGVCEAWGTKTDVDAWAEALADTSGAAAADITGLSDASGRLLAKRYLWSSDGNEPQFLSDVAPKLSENQFQLHIILDLESLAKHLVSQAGRPLFTFEVSRDTWEDRVQRLSGF